MLVRDAARGAGLGVPQGPRATTPVSTQAKGWAQELFKTAERMAADADADVLWVAERDRQRGGNQLCVAPLQVLRHHARQAARRQDGRAARVATLKLGGDFDAVATSVGLRPSSASCRRRASPDVAERPTVCCRGAASTSGSPFDYGQQAILYVARHLPPPGRDGLDAGARSRRSPSWWTPRTGARSGCSRRRRAAEAAAEAVRERLPHLTTLPRATPSCPSWRGSSSDDPHTCLFGTLSLWQGLDVPGETCQLVIIDRIPFPRPDDPLMSARQRAADKAGGNGFMPVAATHAALLLAQGSGRLIRTTTDRGVVAVLDPRLVTARYGSFLRASLPPMWTTDDPKVVRTALGRLAECCPLR